MREEIRASGAEGRAARRSESPVPAPPPSNSSQGSSSKKATTASLRMQDTAVGVRHARSLPICSINGCNGRQPESSESSLELLPLQILKRLFEHGHLGLALLDAAHDHENKRQCCRYQQEQDSSISPQFPRWQASAPRRARQDAPGESADDKAQVQRTPDPKGTRQASPPYPPTCPLRAKRPDGYSTG